MAVHVNPWRETIVLDTCRVCTKSFCCKRDRDIHEEKTHGKLACCVKSLPEICQNCNTFVSNIHDIKSDCVKIVNKSLGVLSECSPNIITDRPRKRTFSAMSDPKQQPLLKEDCSDVIQRTKKQARKRNRLSEKISSSEAVAVKKDSTEISPKFEEVKSSSTPILIDRHDLRKSLLKSKIEVPSTNLNANTVFKSPSLLNSRRSSNFYGRKEGSPSKNRQATPDNDAEKSVYGTPGYGSLTPFCKGKRSYGSSRNGNFNNDSIYGTPRSSLTSFGGSPKIGTVTTYDEDVCMKSVAEDSHPEKENLNTTNVSHLPEIEVKKMDVESDFKENSSEASLQVGASHNKETTENAEMKTPEIKVNDKVLQRAFSINSALKQIERAEFFTEFELQLQVASPSVQEDTAKADCQTSPCSRDAVEVIPSNYRSNSIKDMCVQQNQHCAVMAELVQKIAKYSKDTSNVQNLTGDVKLPSAKETSLLAKNSVNQESLSNSSHKNLGENQNQENTPDSISDKIVKHQFSTNGSLYFKPTNLNENFESPKLEQKVSFISNETIINASGLQKSNPVAFATESILESHFQSFVENKENLRTTLQNFETSKQFNADDSHYKSIEGDLYHEDQVNSEHFSRANFTPNSTVQKHDPSSATPTTHVPSAPQPLVQLTPKQDPDVHWSDTSVEWKSFTVASSNTQESIQSSTHVGSLEVKDGRKTAFKAFNQSFVPESGIDDPSTESPSAVISKSPERSNLNVSDNHPFDILVRAEVIRVNMELQVDRTQKFNVEDAPYSGLEDTLFKMVACHSTPMVRPLNRTSASLDESSLDCTRSRQDLSSLGSASDKKGFFGQAKKRIKSYFPYFFNAKNSKSTENLLSSPLQAHSLSASDATVPEVSRIQTPDQNDSEDQPQGILKRRPIWSWPKRRRPIHENRVRVRDDTFEDTLDSE